MRVRDKMSSVRRCLGPIRSPIGDVAEPPFVQLPDPASHVRAPRAERFAALAQGHRSRPICAFCPALADAQHQLQDGFALRRKCRSLDERKRARDFGMPPLDRGTLRDGCAFDATFGGCPRRMPGSWTCRSRPRAALERAHAGGRGRTRSHGARGARRSPSRRTRLPAMSL